MTDRRFPNETNAYRTARNQLLGAEMELRDHVARVAEQRRKLPMGGGVREDYVFDELVRGASRNVNLSGLFAPGKDSLFLYSFMYGPEMEDPCPMCSSFLDALNGNGKHLTEQINVAVVARSPIERIMEFANKQGWDKLRFVSAAGNTYQSDYFAEDHEGNQHSMANVFARRDGRIHHFWSTVMFWEAPMGGVDSRHIDMLWPLWNILDLTPEGRGEWWPGLV